MAQVTRKWIEDQAINNQKIDPTDSYEVDGLVVDSTSAAGSVGIGTNSPQDALHIRRTSTMADMRLDLADGGSGLPYQINSDAAGRFNIRDLSGPGADRITIDNLGNVGIATNAPATQLHVRSPLSNAALTLDMDNSPGRSYQLISDTAGDFRVYDLDAASTRFQISDIGTVTITGDATVDGNFQVDGTVTVLNTEIIITDELEINQVANRPALTASQDAANSSVVVSVENVGSGPALTTTGAGSIAVGIGTASPTGSLHVYAGASGATAVSTADDLVVENSTTGGISILTPDGSASILMLGSNTDPSGSSIQYQQSTGLMTIGTGLATGQIALRTGNSVEALRIDAAGNLMGKGASALNIAMDTVDASDTKAVFVAGGGVPGITRGAYIGHYGDDHATYPGELKLYSGESGDINFHTGSSALTRMSIAAAGQVSISAGASIPGPTYLLNIGGFNSGQNGISVQGFSTTANRAFIGVNASGHGALDLTNASGAQTISIPASGDVIFNTGGKVGINTTPTGDFYLDSYAAGDENRLRIAAGTASSTGRAGLDLYYGGTKYGEMLVAGTGAVIMGGYTGSTSTVLNVNGVNEMLLSTTLVSIPSNNLEVTAGTVGIGTAVSSYLVDSYTTGDTGFLRTNTGSASTVGSSGLECWYNGAKRAEFYVNGNGITFMGGTSGSSTSILTVNGVVEMQMNATETEINSNNLKVTAGTVGVGTNPSASYSVDTYAAGDTNGIRVNTGSAATTGSSGVECWYNNAKRAEMYVNGTNNVYIGGSTGSTTASITVNATSELNLTATEVTIPTNNLAVSAGTVGIGTAVSSYLVDSRTTGDTGLIRTNTGSAATTGSSGLECWYNGAKRAEFYVNGNGIAFMGGTSGSSTSILTVNGVVEMQMNATETEINSNNLKVTAGTVGVGTNPSAKTVDTYTSGDTNWIRTNTGSASTLGTSGLECWYNNAKRASFYVNGNAVTIMGGDSGSTRTTLMVNGTTELTMNGTETEIGTNNLKITTGTVGIGTAPNASYLIDAYSSSDTCEIRTNTGSASSTAVSGLTLWVNGSKSGHIYGNASGGVNIGASTTGNAVYIAGTLSKFAGSFLIDHPLDPKNKILRHSFVESPEMRNVYYGQATTVGGKAAVTLPEWWGALNGTDKSEFTYQFTSIGAYSRLYVSQEIEGNQFEVTSMDGDCKFSWTVSAIRHDMYAEENRIVIEEDKSEEQKGALLMDG